MCVVDFEWFQCWCNATSTQTRIKRNEKKKGYSNVLPLSTCLHSFYQRQQLLLSENCSPHQIINPIKDKSTLQICMNICMIFVLNVNKYKCSFLLFCCYMLAPWYYVCVFFSLCAHKKNEQTWNKFKRKTNANQIFCIIFHITTLNMVCVWCHVTQLWFSVDVSSWNTKGNINICQCDVSICTNELQCTIDSVDMLQMLWSSHTKNSKSSRWNKSK